LEKYNDWFRKQAHQVGPSTAASTDFEEGRKSQIIQTCDHGDQKRQQCAGDGETSERQKRLLRFIHSSYQPKCLKSAWAFFAP